MSECQVARDDHLASNNNINKNAATSVPHVRPSDEDNSYAMAIRNSSPIAADHVIAAFSDSCDDDEEDEDVTDHEPFDGEPILAGLSCALSEGCSFPDFHQ